MRKIGGVCNGGVDQVSNRNGPVAMAVESNGGSNENLNHIGKDQIDNGGSNENLNPIDNHIGMDQIDNGGVFPFFFYFFIKIFVLFLKKIQGSNW